VRMRIYTEVPGGANEYGLTRENVESWIDNWGGSVVSVATNEVVFDITVKAAFMSGGFWGTAPLVAGVVLTELSYSQATGVHTVEIDASGSSIPIGQIKSLVNDSGASIVSVNGSTAVVEFYRQPVREQFIRALQSALRKVVRPRRYAFSAGDVDTAVGLGGVVMLTHAQLTNKLLDKAG